MISAGESTAKQKKGGNVVVTAGKGSSSNSGDGGDGGHVQIHGGIALGGNKDLNHGGNIELTGGFARTGTGGELSRLINEHR